MFRSKRSRDGHQCNQYIEKWDIGGVNNAVNFFFFSSCTLSAHTLDLNKLAKKDNTHLNQSYGL